MAKQKIELVLCETTIINLQSFKEVEQLNVSVRKYKDRILEMGLRKDLTDNMLRILEYLKRHSCKYPGVSFKGKRKIAADLELTDKTVTRLCARLETLGFIKQHEMKRASDMRQTSSAIVILPVAEEEKAESIRQEPEKKSDHENNIPSKQQNKILNKRKGSDNSHTYDHTYVSSNIPQDFIEAVRPFFPTPKEIYKLWHRLTLAARQSRFPGDFEAHIDDWVKTFKEAVYREKQGKVRGDFLGYLYGAWRTSMRIVACRLNRDQFGSWLYAD